MNKSGQIVVIEDDVDDRECLISIFKSLDFENEIVYFENGEAALEYLIAVESKPFLIISDINMPRLNGMELKERIQNNEDLRLKCIPYLLFTTSANQQHVIDAYSKSVQGFFVKPNDIGQFKSIVKKIVEYWQECESPNYLK